MKTAAAYIRVSTDDQVEYSPDSQIRLIREYAKRNEYILPEEFIFADEGVSGRTAAKRPEFIRMISLAKTRPAPFDVILVYSFSRFARNREDSIVYKRMLRRDLDIDVISITQDFGDSKASIITEAIFEAMDEYYSIDLAENVKRGMTEKARRGEVMCAPPLGYKVENNVFVPDLPAAEVVRSIFADFASGEGYGSIARKLNLMGYRTKFGNSFANRSIKDIIRNNTYIGMLSWSTDGRRGRTGDIDGNIITVKGKHEPLISQELWEQSQARADEFDKMYGGKARSTAKHEFMLRGLVRCSNCGSTLVLSKALETLQCYKYAHSQCAISHSILLRYADEAMMETLARDTVTGDIDLEIQQPPPSGIDVAKIKSQLAREQIKLDRVKDAYQNGIDTLEEYRSNKAVIAANIKQLEKTLKQPAKNTDTQAARERFAKKHREVLKKLQNDKIDEVARNRLLRSIIKYAVFDREEGSFKIHYYC